MRHNKLDKSIISVRNEIKAAKTAMTKKTDEIMEDYVSRDCRIYREICSMRRHLSNNDKALDKAKNHVRMAMGIAFIEMIACFIAVLMK